MNIFHRLLHRSLVLAFILNFTFAVLLVLYRTLPTNNHSHARSDSEASWIATSPSWLDRTACRWIDICGGVHWLGQTWLFHRPSQKQWPADFWKSSVTDADWDDPEATDPQTWSDAERYARDIPKCVLDYAPLIYLHPDESYWIADPAEHLKHVQAKFHGATIASNYTLGNLSLLNEYRGGREVCLTSLDNIDDQPPWMTSNWTIPQPFPPSTIPEDPGLSHLLDEDPNIVGDREGWYHAAPTALPTTLPVEFRYTDWPTILPGPTHQTPGLSPAPAILLTTRKSNNTLDAFWFIFNSFNQGNKVLGMRFGNHVGDWEHVMIRFQACSPKALYTSRHSFGNAAYAWNALEKIGSRPVVYAARGSHAMYVTEGVQGYKLPLNMLADTTGRGPLWDPALQGLKAFTYDVLKREILASSISPRAATGWLHYMGSWGDERFPLGDGRQYRFVGEYHYSTGPNGPKFKNLERSTVCERRDGECDIKNMIP